MKTNNNLYPQICAFDNIFLAYKKARKGKRTHPGPAAFERVQEEELLAIQKELITHAYIPGAYHSFFVHEPKKRLISAAPFCDRVVHHALCQVIEPVWERRFIFDSYANRIGKGTHRALDRTTHFSRRNRYVLQCDVRQFFPSIDHEILRQELSRIIWDKETIWLCDQILQSGAGILSGEYDLVYFPGDDLFAANRLRGLPIGNLTSQFWANVYLNRFDHFVKRELKCPTYLRYVDDFLLFSNDKSELWTWRQAIIKFLATWRLTLHEGSAQVYPVETGIPFLGFRLFPGHRRVKRRKVIHFRRKLARNLHQYIGNHIPYEKLNASIQGWINHVRYADSWGLRRAMLRSVHL